MMSPIEIGTKSFLLRRLLRSNDTDVILREKNFLHPISSTDMAQEKVIYHRLEILATNITVHHSNFLKSQTFKKSGNSIFSTNQLKNNYV